MLNIVIPMAGRGSRFQQVGYREPKPLIPVLGKPMIERVIDNLRPATPHRFVFICQRQHLDEHGLEARLRALAPGAVVQALDGVTEGAACTVLTVREHIDDGEALMIANCDQYIDASIDAYLDHLRAADLDGLIMTMTADDPKWSFAAVDGAGRVTRVAEKQVISHHATVGIYNFRRGRDFVAAADAMVARGERVNGEFYVAPVYNDLVAQGERIGIFDIGREADGMYGLGTPADLDLFLEPQTQARLTRRLA